MTFNNQTDHIGQKVFDSPSNKNNFFSFPLDRFWLTVNSNDGALVDHLEEACTGDDRTMRGKNYIKVQKITIS